MCTGRRRFTGSCRTRRRRRLLRSTIWAKRGWKIRIQIHSSSSGFTTTPAPNTAPNLRCITTRGRTAGMGSFLRTRDSGSGISKSEPAERDLVQLEDAGGAHAAADAHGDHAVAGVAALHFAQQRRGELGAGAAQRMAERNGAAVDVHLLGIETERANDGQRLCGKSLIQLDDADVVSLRPASLSALGTA